MIGLDTNVWVRYVTNDDPRQAALAVELIARCATIYVGRTVLLELEWVLRGVYELDRDTVVRALLQILGLSNVAVEAPERVALALEYHQQGLDFADALHLTGARYDAFHTFDTGFVKQGQRLGFSVEPVDSPSTSGSV